MPNAVRTSVSAIVLGGAANALSVARNLGRHGIDVVALNYPHEAIRFSRYARFIALKNGYSPDEWAQFLLSRDSDGLRGSALLACSDEAISIIVDNYSALAKKFLLEEGDPLVRRDLLNKFTICKRAEEAGVPTVGYWHAGSDEKLEQAIERLRFPMIMKPLYGPNAALIRSKALLLSDRGMLQERLSEAAQLGVDVLLMEYIPGADDRLCSYYTYLDENGNALVHLTKRLKRRYPCGSGDGTYHVTDWIPDAAELGAKFFRHIKLKGLGNIEFKRDARDNKLKIIEVNARFTASDCLIAKSGVNLPLITYNRLAGRSQGAAFDYRKSLTLCRVFQDARAAWELRNRGELRPAEWIADLCRVNQFPLFDWRDPLPAMASCWQFAGRFGKKSIAALTSSHSRRARNGKRMNGFASAANQNDGELPHVAQSRAAE